MDQPMSMDPQEMAHNFATSSILDRSKVSSKQATAGYFVTCIPI